MSDNTPSLKRIAKSLIDAEVNADEGGELVTAGWWGALVERILDDLPPATEPRIAGLIINYLLGEDDGTG